MKKIFRSLIILGMIGAVSACSPANNNLKQMKQLRKPADANGYVPYQELYNPDYLAFKAKMKTFAADLSETLIKQEFKEDGNVALSPISIELCLGLAVRGAGGTTRQELLNAIGIDYETFNTYYATLFKELSFEKKNNANKVMAQLLPTNSIWIDNDVKLLDSGLDALRDDYYCYSYEADFNDKNKESCAAIKEFTKEKTKGLIDLNLELSVNTLFVLLNTIYLKDVWNDFGDELSYASTDYKFTNRNGDVSNKRLLTGHYVEGRKMKSDSYSAFKTCTNNGFYIYFVRPNDGQDIKQIFTKETIEYVSNSKNYIYESEELREIYFTRSIFPEFKGESDIDLIKTFKEKYNVQTLFDVRCDFTNLDEGNEVYCSNFRHVAKLDVNKKGIEGAAVTYMAMDAKAAGPGEYTEVYEDFLVDKEFGFILTYGDNIIFSGITNNID